MLLDRFAIFLVVLAVGSYANAEMSVASNMESDGSVPTIGTKQITPDASTLKDMNCIASSPGEGEELMSVLAKFRPDSADEYVTESGGRFVLSEVETFVWKRNEVAPKVFYGAKKVGDGSFRYRRVELVFILGEWACFEDAYNIYPKGFKST